jgi:hypothetical protein
LGGDREAFRALVAQLAVWPVMVGLTAVVLNDYAGFGQRPELLPVEALVAEASMETLDEAILPGTTGRLPAHLQDRPTSVGLPQNPDLILYAVLLPFIRLVPFGPDYLIPRLEKAESRQVGGLNLSQAPRGSPRRWL